VATIAIVASCDTKYHEVRFVEAAVRKAGHIPLIIDISVGRDSSIKSDISKQYILEQGGYNWTEVRDFTKSKAIDAMSESVSKVLPKLCADGKVDGAFGMGGLQNTVMCSAAFRALPLGFPKIIVSTIACGYRYFDLVVGDKDITVVPSVVDFAGLNPVSEVVLNNAISAIIGMVEHGGGKINTQGRFLIGTTLMGITNDSVMAAADKLINDGREVMSFHSTGIGGRVMEQMIADGHIKAVMDLTLHEMTAEYFGELGYSRGANNRLCAAAKAGIPMLVVPGGIDFICLDKHDLFEDHEKRGFVWHNSELTHTQLYESEILDITRTICKRLNKAAGKVSVVLPMGGLRTLSYPGETFHKPETIKKMKEIFENELKPEISFKCVDLNFMDAAFPKIIYDEMSRLLGKED